MNKQTSLAALKKSLASHCERFLDHGFDASNPRVYLHAPTWGAEEIWEALESLISTRVTLGEKVRRFEKRFADNFGFSQAVMVNSGSSANLLAFSVLCNPATSNRFKAGDEIIVPALSWSTSVWPIIQHNLVPVIVDIDPRTLNADPGHIERAISPKTKGIMLVHVYGNPCDMRAIMDIARRRQLTVVEDCCEALGASFDGRAVGSFGRIGTFSFYFSHHITTLEGGMCVSEEFDVAEMFRILRAHGWIRDNVDGKRYTSANPGMDPRFLFVNVGYNLRPTEVQGGFGLVQIEKLRAFIGIRRDNARYWKQALGRFNEFFAFQEETPSGSHSWFGFPMVVQESAPFSVGELTSFLNKHGIETRPIIAGNIAAQPAMRYYEHRIIGELAHSNHIMRNGFAFGNHQAVTKEAREYVVRAFEDFLRSKKLA